VAEAFVADRLVQVQLNLSALGLPTIPDAEQKDDAADEELYRKKGERRDFPEGLLGGDGASAPAGDGGHEHGGATLAVKDHVGTNPIDECYRLHLRRHHRAPA
jgi:hypothetical protein